MAGLLGALIALAILLLMLKALSGIHAEQVRQSKILYEIAVVLKADVPESFRPLGGFFSEISRGLKGK